MTQAATPQALLDAALAALKKAGGMAAGARLLGMPTTTFKNRIEAATRPSVKIKILLLDIETAPHLGYIWGLFDQNISIKQLLESGYILCWSAKWLGEETIYFDSVHQSSPKAMLVTIHQLLDECDAVIHYNGARFDIPTLNKEFLLHGMKPPSPYKQIDLLRTARSQFKLASNKLEYVAKVLGVGAKHEHYGFQLWVDCMAGSKKAWKIMKEYNIQDTELLEKVYWIFRPWIKNHPNVGLYNADPECCPTCGSTSFNASKDYRTNARTYKGYKCGGCGTRFRGQVKAGQSRVFCGV